MWWRSPITDHDDTLVWDTVVCTLCHQQYIRPQYASDPCPYCAKVGRV